MESPRMIEENPLSELINDETFRTLNSLGLFNFKQLRDYIIRKKYRKMRNNNIPAKKAIQILRTEYGYLQPDTLRKIIYNIK
jgi:hypothetical protein